MEKRVAQNRLLDVYGALLSEHQLEVCRLHLEEDLSFTEIAERLSCTRQGAHDAFRAADQQLEKLEDALHLLNRSERVQNEIRLCREALLKSPADVQSALYALERMEAAVDGV